MDAIRGKYGMGAIQFGAAGNMDASEDGPPEL